MIRWNEVWVLPRLELKVLFTRSLVVMVETPWFLGLENRRWILQSLFMGPAEKGLLALKRPQYFEHCTNEYSLLYFSTYKPNPVLTLVSTGDKLLLILWWPFRFTVVYVRIHPSDKRFLRPERKLSCKMKSRWPVSGPKPGSRIHRIFAPDSFTLDEGLICYWDPEILKF